MYADGRTKALTCKLLKVMRQDESIDFLIVENNYN